MHTYYVPTHYMQRHILAKNLRTYTCTDIGIRMRMLQLGRRLLFPRGTDDGRTAPWTVPSRIPPFPTNVLDLSISTVSIWIRCLKICLVAAGSCVLAANARSKSRNCHIWCPLSNVHARTQAVRRNLGAHINVLSKNVFHMFHSRRSKHRRALVKC